MQLVDVAHSLSHAQYPDLETLRTQYGWSDRNHRIFDRMFGLKSTALHPDLSLHQALSLSARDLARRNPALVGKVDYVFYCHAVNITIPFTKGFLEGLIEDHFDCRPEVMSIAHGACASAIMVLHMLRRFPTDRPLNVIIMTGEKCFFDLQQFADNQGLYGEATACAFVRLGTAEGTQVTATEVGHFDGIYAPMFACSKEQMMAFDQGFLPKILLMVKALLDKAELHPEDVGLIFPTHLSPFTSNRVAEQLGMKQALVLKTNLPHIGHCYCGDLFMNYQTWLQDNTAQPANIISFASGMTGSYAGIVLKRN